MVGPPRLRVNWHSRAASPNGRGRPFPYDRLMDAFDILGFPAVFRLDLHQVEDAYLRKAVELHPDLGGADPEEVAAAAAAINEAKRILQNPEARANLLLARLGGPSMQTERALPDGFLARMMSTREEIEEVIESGRTEDITRWRTWAAAERQRYESDVAALFDEATEAATSSSQQSGALRSIRLKLNAWRYIERLIEQLNDEGAA